VGRSLLSRFPFASHVCPDEKTVGSPWCERLGGFSCTCNAPASCRLNRRREDHITAQDGIWTSPFVIFGSFTWPMSSATRHSCNMNEYYNRKSFMDVLIIAVLIGLIPAFIAKNKGRSLGLWWFYGAAIFIVALPHALIMRADQKTIEKNKISEGMK